jgi:hypothetical protein
MRRLALSFVFLAMIAASSPPHASAQEAQFTITPNEAPPGTVLTARSVTPCPAQAGEDPRVRVLLLGQITGGAVETSVSVPPTGGPWEVQLAIPADFPPGLTQVEAACLTGPANASSSSLAYAFLAFNVVAPAAAPPPPVEATPRLTG